MLTSLLRACGLAQGEATCGSFPAMKCFLWFMSSIEILICLFLEIGLLQE